MQVPLSVQLHHMRALLNDAMCAHVLSPSHFAMVCVCVCLTGQSGLECLWLSEDSYRYIQQDHATDPGPEKSGHEEPTLAATQGRNTATV